MLEYRSKDVKPSAQWLCHSRCIIFHIYHKAVSMLSPLSQNDGSLNCKGNSLVTILCELKLSSGKTQFIQKLFTISTQHMHLNCPRTTLLYAHKYTRLTQGAECKNWKQAYLHWLYTINVAKASNVLADGKKKVLSKYMTRYKMITRS